MTDQVTYHPDVIPALFIHLGNSFYNLAAVEQADPVSGDLRVYFSSGRAVTLKGDQALALRAHLKKLHTLTWDLSDLGTEEESE